MGAIIVCVNVDPHSAQEGIALVPDDLDLPDGFARARPGDRRRPPAGRRGANYVRLDPARAARHVFRVEP